MGKGMRPGSIEYDPILADEILERLADGDSLASICCVEEMPDERSVRRWARNHGDFGAKYAVARRLGYEKRADELLEIADDSSADWIDTDDGHRVLNAAHVNRARLMIDTRKWLLSKMLPKVYGDHLTIAGDLDQRSATLSNGSSGALCRTRRSRPSRHSRSPRNSASTQPEKTKINCLRTALCLGKGRDTTPLSASLRLRGGTVLAIPARGFTRVAVPGRFAILGAMPDQGYRARAKRM